MFLIGGVLEFIIVIVSLVLIVLGRATETDLKSYAKERKIMTLIGIFLLSSWVIFSAVPGLFRNIRENRELRKLRKNGYFRDQINQESNKARKNCRNMNF